MGNGASTSHGQLLVDGEQLQIVEVKNLIMRLKSEVKVKTTELDKTRQELTTTRIQLKEKENEVAKCKAEIHKLKSVLTVKVQDGKQDVLSTIHESSKNVAGRLKKQGVSGESSGATLATGANIEISHVEKDFRSKQLIRAAIMENDFLKMLDSTQLREVVDCMYLQKFASGSHICVEGESGQQLYVSAGGDLEVTHNGAILGQFGAGRAFGELAVLYNCTRTASVKALSPVQVWVLDRPVFQAIMMKTGLQRQEENICFLQSVPLLKTLPAHKLAKIADVLEVDFFHESEYIIREGATGDTFFIINKGEVKVTQSIQGFNDPQEVRQLKRGDYFGEKSLLSEDRRTANVIACPPGVECLTVDRSSFNQLIGDLNELREKDYGDAARGAQRSSGSSHSSDGSGVSPGRAKAGGDRVDAEFTLVRLEDLEVLTTLGMGGFGRVELVQLSTDKKKAFALKCLKKKHIVDTRQQEHIYSEKKIMMDARSPFIARFYKTFKDAKFVYMLLEACLGGELWTILRDRDLKPENLLLTNKGYVKLVDFGFAKRIGSGRKTWTFCGTPEYVAPEIILNKGHDHAVDYWSPPFNGSDPMKTYNIILKGIDVIEFSKKISRNAQALIKRLCRDNAAERLGYGKNGIVDIKKNKWFQGFDWEGLMNQTLVPPIQPKVKGPTDYSNFDSYSKDTDIPPDELSGWDTDF